MCRSCFCNFLGFHAAAFEFVAIMNIFEDITCAISLTRYAFSFISVFLKGTAKPFCTSMTCMQHHVGIDQLLFCRKNDAFLLNWHFASK